MASAWKNVMNDYGYSSEDGKQLIDIPGEGWSAFWNLLFSEFINSSPKPVSKMSLKSYRLHNLPISNEELNISVVGQPKSNSFARSGARSEVVNKFYDEGKVWMGMEKWRLSSRDEKTAVGKENRWKK